MHYFLTHAKLTPDKLLEISEDDIIKKYTHVKQKYLQMGKSASAHRIYVVLSTFLESNRKKITFTKRDKVTVEEKRVRRQYIPKKSEIYRMADSSGSLRNRAIILVMFQSGIRKNAVSSLTYGHVKGFLYPELTIPVRMRITDDIDSKNRKYKIKYYFAFLQDEAAEALKTYIDYRKDVEGWQAKDDDLIFISDSNFNSKGMPQPLSSGAINAMVKRSAKHIGLDPERFWAHLLRKSFRKILYQAPIDNDLAEAIMGHQLKDSKENYFDRYDHDWIASEYMKAPFSREGVGRLYHLEKENQKLEAKIATQQEEIESLKDDLTEMKEMFKDLFKKQES
jgi:integrase